MSRTLLANECNNDLRKTEEPAWKDRLKPAILLVMAIRFVHWIMLDCAEPFSVGCRLVVAPLKQVYRVTHIMPTLHRKVPIRKIGSKHRGKIAKLYRAGLLAIRQREPFSRRSCSEGPTDPLRVGNWAPMGKTMDQTHLKEPNSLVITPVLRDWSFWNCCISSHVIYVCTSYRCSLKVVFSVGLKAGWDDQIYQDILMLFRPVGLLVVTWFVTWKVVPSVSGGFRCRSGIASELLILSDDFVLYPCKDNS